MCLVPYPPPTHPPTIIAPHPNPQPRPQVWLKLLYDALFSDEGEGSFEPGRLFEEGRSLLIKVGAGGMKGVEEDRMEGKGRKGEKGSFELGRLIEEGRSLLIKVGGANIRGGRAGGKGSERVAEGEREGKGDG